jgi:ubiquinone/menaquinone biosynthesis C-methylase UbiE
MLEKDQQSASDLAIHRHNLDSDLFLSRYQNLKFGKHTDVFIYGREMIIEEILADLKKLPKGARILDVGSGTGHLAKMCHDLGFQVTGLEPAEKMIEKAQDGFPEITFVRGVSSKLPFDTHSFDYILCIEVLRYLDSAEITKTYAEFRRVLKPNGRLFATHVNRFASDFYWPYHHLSSLVKRVRNQARNHCHFTSSAKEVEALKTAGFEDASALGRLNGFVRLFYKLGNKAGRTLTRFSEFFDEKQLFESGPRCSFSGHLIVRAQNGAQNPTRTRASEK